MKYSYQNNTDRAVIYRNNIWQPGEVKFTSYPVPLSSGLTCVQEGDCPDPVLFHDDILVGANEQRTFALNAPTISQNVALTILSMSQNSGVECRFNSANNKAIPIDVRGFQQVMAWELCSKIIVYNPSDNEAHISLTAIEVN